MKTGITCLAIMLLMFSGTLLADLTPPPKAPKAKPTAQVRDRAAQPAGATGVFVAQLRPDGTVQKVLIARSTGNQVVDANAVRGLSLMRFPPETLTKEQRAKGQIVVPMTSSAEELKKFRYRPKPQW
jgi:TonB family protein